MKTRRYRYDSKMNCNLQYCGREERQLKLVDNVYFLLLLYKALHNRLHIAALLSLKKYKTATGDK